MNFYDVLLAKKLNGGGGSPIDLRTLTVTENGEQDAPSGVAYNKVITNVPAPSNAIYKQTLTGLPSPIATFTGADAPLDSLKASIVGVQSGSGDPSPSNVRPISGWSSCVVNRTGKNMLNETAGVAGFFKSDGSIQSSQAWKYQYIKVNPNTNYTISNIPAPVPAVYLCWFDVNKNFISNSGSHDNVTITSPNNALYLGFCVNQNSELGARIQIEAGNQATAYEPYNGNTYTIPFKDSSDNPITVYDGGIDVTGGSWLNNRLFEVFDNTATVTFGRDSQPNWYYQIAGTSTGTSGETAETISNMYSYANIGNDNDNLGIMKMPNGNIRLRVGGTQPATVDDFVNSLGITPLQVVSKLATPQTGIFTPVNIRSNGVTNISVNCGNVTELKYYSETP